MFAIMIRSLFHDARTVRRGDRDRRDEVGFARPDAADADHVAGFYVAGELGLHVRRRVNEDGRLRLAVHDKAVDLAVRVEKEAFDGAFTSGRQSGSTTRRSRWGRRRRTEAVGASLGAAWRTRSVEFGHLAR